VFLFFSKILTSQIGRRRTEHQGLINLKLFLNLI
jgi:hypothetical protein